MLDRIRPSLAWSLITVIAVGSFAVLSAQPSKKKTLKQPPDARLDLEQSKFMRMKLEASGQILEGLATDDADLIKKGAKQLAEMSIADRWMVNTDVIYRQFSGEFQRSTKNLLEAADKENFDAAALKWIETTMKCLECHKFVRGEHLAGNAR